MRECPDCKVKIKSTKRICPLCGRILNFNKDNDQENYPKYVERQKEVNIINRIILFIAIITIIPSLIINLLTYNDTLWFLYIVMFVFYFWILLKSTILSRTNVIRRLIVQMLTISIIMYGIDVLSKGNNWSLNYIIPFICTITITTSTIIVFSKKMKYNEYIMHWIGVMVMGFVPFILYLTKVVNVLWPSVTSAGIAFITITSMAIFADRETKDELKKRFHI